MSEAAARGNGVDSVRSETGSGKNCANPLTTSTNECSSDVIVNGTGIVREGDLVTEHPKRGCLPDTSVLTTFSFSVIVNGKGAGRKNDFYTTDNKITSGSPDVFIGG